MNFVLGTASFGAIYGVANPVGELNELEVYKILHEAKRLGVKVLDSAPSYGRAEKIIGDFHQQGEKFEVISKISDVQNFSSRKLIDEIEKSASILNISKFSAMLFHKSEELAKFPERQVNEALENILSSGLVKTLGVSVYKEEEIRFVSRSFPRITLFQVPENIMDRRLRESELISELSRLGIRFHVRSIFLQGLLLMNRHSLPSELSEAELGLDSLLAYSKMKGVSNLDSCLSYVSEIEWASGIVIGVNSKKHLQEVVSYQKIKIDLDKLPSAFPEYILDPREWANN